MPISDTGTLLRTTDFRQAGYLTAHGVYLVSTEINSKREVVFVFQESEAIILLQDFSNSIEHRYDVQCKSMHNIVRAKLSGK